MNSETIALIIDLHLRNERQGPGGEKETLKAAQLAGLPTDRRLEILDVGCGTGASAFTLADHYDARVTCVDISQEFLGAVEEKAEERAYYDQIVTDNADMSDLPFEDEEFDVVWSEGAIYNIGFKRGVNEWRRLLKPDGILAVSEIAWFKDDVPEELKSYWQNAYSEISTVDAKRSVLEDAGYEVIDVFNLPRECWTESYYKPLSNGFDPFLERNKNSQSARDLVEMEREEIALYEKYGDFYGYAFFVARKSSGD